VDEPTHGRRLFLFFAEQPVARSIDEMKPATGLAKHRFVGTALIAGHGLVRQPMLHVHAGLGTFEDEVAHGAGQSDDCTVFRLDPCQCQSGSVMQPALQAAPCESQISHLKWTCSILLSLSLCEASRVGLNARQRYALRVTHARVPSAEY